MTEIVDRLRETLGALHRELDHIDPANPEMRRLLEETVAEIRDHLQTHPTQATPQTVTERLNEAARHFEESHPTLGGLLNNTVDLLGRMGI